MLRLTSELHQNLVGGAFHDAALGHVFETRVGLGPRGYSARWPRSGARDARAAITAALDAEGAWRGRSDRDAVVRRFLDALAGDDEGREALAARLGVPPEVLLRHWPRRLGRAGGSDAPASSVVVFRPHWSELVVGPAAELADLLCAGATVVWIADPRVPEIPDAFAHAFVELGTGEGVLNVLFEDGDNTLRAALDEPAAGTFVGSGTKSEVARLEELVRTRDEGRPGPTREYAPFGAGVVELPGLSTKIRRIENATHRVPEGADPALEAEHVLRGAFGVADTLGGQLPGQIARVFCPRRLFSRFTEELLERLEAAEMDVGHFAIDPGLAAYVRRLRDLGLDEGATLVHEGSRASGSEARLGPFVFTNVEEHMALARKTRPAPVLSLLREDGESWRAAPGNGGQE